MQQKTRSSFHARHALTLAVLGAFAAGAVQAGAKLEIDDEHWVSLGAGTKLSYRSVEDSSPSGEDRSNDFGVDSFRIYINGQVHKYIKLEFNTEREGDPSDLSASDIRVLDAIAKFEFNDYANFWFGRFLPPSDRFNLDGPYYLNTFDFPTVQAYPAIFAGRDDGAAYWGQAGEGKFKWQVGVFEGTEGAASPNQDDSLLYAGRLTLNLLDPEPGYYNSSTYYGEKDILAIGVAGMFQEDGTGTAATPGDFSGLSVDALFEKNLGAGTLSLEGAYFDYDHDDVTPRFGYEGEGYLALAAFLFPQQIGIGQFQPHVRYQNLDADSAADEREITEVGLTYVIKGHNARVSAIVGEDDPNTGDETNFFLLGIQIQI